jgi:tRNA-(ms[2]io[6]A)-hydroxylase
MRQRGISLVKEIPKDPYITALMKLLHSDRVRRFLDRLLLASIIECRGAERFRLVSEALSDDKELQQFYHDLWVSEAKHGHIFVGMALEYFEKNRVYARLTELNEAEGRIVDGLEIRAALH